MESGREEKVRGERQSVLKLCVRDNAVMGEPVINLSVTKLLRDDKTE